jgi:hypothetical protein
VSEYDPEVEDVKDEDQNGEQTSDSFSTEITQSPRWPTRADNKEEIETLPLTPALERKDSSPMISLSNEQLENIFRKSPIQFTRGQQSLFTIDSSKLPQKELPLTIHRGNEVLLSKPKMLTEEEAAKIVEKHRSEEEKRRKRAEGEHFHSTVHYDELQAALDEDRLVDRTLRIVRFSPEGKQHNNKVSLISITLSQPLVGEAKDISFVVQFLLVIQF